MAVIDWAGSRRRANQLLGAHGCALRIGRIGIDGARREPGYIVLDLAYNLVDAPEVEQRIYQRYLLHGGD